MKKARTLIASATALGLATAPLAAQAAPTRTATPAAHSAQLAGEGSILYLALAAFAVAMIIVVASSNNGSVPVSP